MEYDVFIPLYLQMSCLLKMAKYGYKILTKFATAGNNVVTLSRNTLFCYLISKRN